MMITNDGLSGKCKDYKQANMRVDGAETCVKGLQNWKSGFSSI
jgi:hypothetical protein